MTDDVKMENDVSIEKEATNRRGKEQQKAKQRADDSRANV